MNDNKIEQLTHKLLTFYLTLMKNKEKDILLLETKPGDDFFNELYSEQRFRGIYSFDLIEDFIDSYMSQFKKNKIDYQDVVNFLNELESYLMKNLQEYWIIAPLSDALLSHSEIFSDNLLFLNLTKESSKDYLKNLLGDDYFDHINQKYKNLDISFDDVVIGYKITCQTNYIENYYNVLAHSLNALIHLYYYAEIYPQYDHSSKKIEYLLKKIDIPSLNKSKDLNFIILTAERNKLLKPTRYDTTCKLDLSFFYEKTHMDNFMQLVSFLLKEIPTRNILIKKLLHSILLFKSSIELESKNNYLGLSLPAILLTTASESLLLNDKDSKKINLKNILSSVYKKTDYSNKDVKNVVHQMYSLRSEFVHGGTRIYKDFKDDFSIGDTSKLFLNYKRILSGCIYDLSNYMLSLDETERTIDSFEQYIQKYKI